MNAVPVVIFLTLSSVGMVGLLGYCMYTLFREVDQYRLRILKLSRLLQRIEYTTGEPYFTTSGNYLEIEDPEWLLKSIQKEALRQSYYRNKEAEEEENQEEDQEEETQEEDQEEENQEEENQEEENQEEENQEEEKEEHTETEPGEESKYVPLNPDIQLSPLEQIARSE